MLYLVMIDWGGPPLSGEQQLALRNIASIYLRRGTYDKKVNFTHALVEGKLTFRGRTILGAFSGNRFFVDFGTHWDLPWYCEFVLPTNRESVDIDEDDVVFSGRIENGDITMQDSVDIGQARATHDNIIG